MSHSHSRMLSPWQRRLGRRSPYVLTGARSRHRPRFDIMEDRTLLSTWLVFSSGDSGPGSLRQAILNSNAATGATNSIVFLIAGSGVHLIVPLSPLPEITSPVLIDGFSQPGYAGTPLIELSGTRLGSGSVGDGLAITGSDVTVRGLDVNNFSRGAGIHITGTGATGNAIYGNFLGTDPTGFRAKPNEEGVEVDGGATDNLIGTSGTGAPDENQGNLLSGNSFAGVWIHGQGTKGNIVAGNLIGTSVTGDTELPNGQQTPYGYAFASRYYDYLGGGVVINLGASGNQIGAGSPSGPAAGLGNVISGNNNDGIDLSGSGTNGNVVQGNAIGTDLTGALDLGNRHDGIEVDYGAAGNTIGGLAAGASNLITDNGGDGVVVKGNNSVGDEIIGNSIFANVGQAIDLGGSGVVLANGTGPRQGPNNLQNFPIVVTAADGQLEGWLGGSLADTSYRIDFYASAASSADGSGEAEDFLGSIQVTTDATGQVEFPVPFSAPAGLPIVTATATDPAGNTSEVMALRPATLEAPTATLRVAPGQAVVFSSASGHALAIQDPNVGPLGPAWGLTLSVSAGTLTLSSTTGLAGSGDGTGSLSYSGALSALNAALAGATYTAPQGYQGYLTLNVNAQSGGAAPIRQVQLQFLVTTGRFAVTTTADNGAGSLRQAILDSNADPLGTNTIDFNIPGSGVRSIAPMSPLPAITNPVLIDGTSQPGYSGAPLIELSGSQAGGGDGLIITASGVTVRGLDINSFSQGAGIEFRGTGATGGWIYANLLGTDPTGTEAEPNQFGVEIDGGATQNRIGTNGDGALAAALGNVLSGNALAGVWISGQGTDDNVVAGNFIGTDAAGTARLPNAKDGVDLEAGASANTIGGPAASAGNLIADNDGAGVAVAGDSAGDSILGNRILGNAGLAINLSRQVVSVDQIAPTLVAIGPGRLQGWLLGRVPDATFYIEFFASAAYGPGGSGEADHYLGSLEVTTDGRGEAVFAVPFTPPPGLPIITATATDAQGNTSEISALYQGSFLPLASVMSVSIGSTSFGALTQGGTEVFAIQPDASGLLDAAAHASSNSLQLRLSLFDAQGNLLVQSDGQSSVDPDPLIEEHLEAGSYYLEVQSLTGSGSYSLSTSLTPVSGLYQPLPISIPYTSNLPLVAAGDFTNNGILDLVTPQGVYLGAGDGTFQPPALGGALVDPSEGEATAIAVGDFINGNPNLDVAIALTVSANFVETSSLAIFLGNGDGTFQPPRLISLPFGAPSAIIAGDFGNGNIDLAVVGGGGVTILLGNGQGAFAVSENIPTGGNVACDFEDDGRLDLAVASFGTAAVTILSNLGDGTFQAQPPIPLPAGHQPFAIVAGDFGRGSLDLAVADAADEQVDILQGNGDGTFRLATTVADGLAGDGDGILYPAVVGPGSMVAGDFGNGHLDLAILAPLTRQVAVLLGNGDGTFQPPVVTDTTAAISNQPLPANGENLWGTMVASNFNGDGRLDLAIAKITPLFGYGGPAIPGAITIFLGNGNGTFQEPAANSVVPSAGAVATGEFTGDGNLDLAVVNGVTNTVSILLGNGDGTFQPATTLALPAGAGTIGGIVTGDFNGDGLTDLAVSDSNLGVSVFLGDGNGTFQPPRTYPVAGGAAGIVAGDFTGNRRLDLAVISPVIFPITPTANVTILLNNGDGTFRSEPPIPITDPTIPPGSLDNKPALLGIVAGEFTGDGRVDLAVAVDPYAKVGYFGSAPDNITVLRGNGDGTFQAQPPISLGVFQAAILSLVVGDFRNDGRTDLAVAIDNEINESDFTPVGEDSIEVLLSNGDGTFQPPSVIDLDNENLVSPDDIVAGDFNGDGKLDLATADHVYKGNAGTVEDDYSVYLGNGDGTFEPPTYYALGGTGISTALVTGDFAGNGRTDLAIIQREPDRVFVQLNNGDATFSGPTSTNLARNDTPLVVDLTGDGTPDVIEVDSAGDILFRQGLAGQPGSFLPPVIVNPPLPDGSNAYLSRDIAWVPQARQGPLLASVDAQDNAISLYAFSNGRFIRIGSFTTGSLPAQIIAADLKGSGWDDLVVRNAADGTLSVFFNNGKGSSPTSSSPFGGPLTLFVGPGISDVAAVDTSGTGGLDLVVTNQVSGQVSVLRNQGDGTFAPLVSYRAGAELSQIGTSSVPEVISPEATTGVAAGPLTPGGLTDLVTINPGSNTLDVLVGLGRGRFANPVEIDTPSPAKVVRVADFTANGILDLAVLTADGVSIYLGDGKGGFSPPVTYNAGTAATGLTVADILGNGHLDLLVGNLYGDILILVGNGDGTFRPFEPLKQAIALAVADLTGNGVPDFVIADQSLNQITVQYGTATQHAGSPQVIGNQATGVLAPGAVKLADLNGDGIPDLIVANSGGNNVLVYPGLGNGQFGAPVNGTKGFPVGTDPTGLTVANLNGQPDLLVADTGSNDVSVLLGQGSGPSWTMISGARVQTDAGPVALAVGHLLGPTQTDLAVANSGADNVQIFPGIGGGFFNEQPQAVKTYAVGQAPSSLFLGNFSGSGLGLATLNAGSNNGTLIGNVGSPNPVIQSFPTGGNSPTSGFAGDFTNNGFTDLVVGNNGDGQLALLLGGPSGLSLSQVLSSAEVPNPTALSFAGVSNGLLEFYVSTAGVEAAMNLAFDLNASPESESGGGVASVDVSPSAGLSVGGVLAELTSGSVQQVALLLNLTGTTLDLAATLLTVSVVETESSAASAVTASSTSPGQSQANGNGGSGESEDELAENPEGAAPAVQAVVEKMPPWERQSMGFERAWERAREWILELESQRPTAGDKKPSGQPAVSRPPERPDPATTQRTTDARSKPGSPSDAAAVDPTAPANTTSDRGQEDTGRAVDAALENLAVDQAGHGQADRSGRGIPEEPAAVEQPSTARVVVAVAVLAGATRTLRGDRSPDEESTDRTGPDTAPRRAAPRCPRASWHPNGCRRRADRTKGLPATWTANRNRQSL
jgi:hypothetical protein